MRGATPTAMKVAWVVACIAVASTSTVAHAAKPRALILEMRGDAVSLETRKSVTGVVAVELTRDARLDVVSGEDVRNLAQLEAQRQEVGCDDSCLAEIADAMNA